MHLITLLCIWIVQANPTTLYVIPAKLTDNISGTGTSNDPFNSLGKALQTVSTGTYTILLGFRGTDQVMLHSGATGTAGASINNNYNSNSPTMDQQPFTQVKNAVVTIRSQWCTSDPGPYCDTNNMIQTVVWLNFQVSIRIIGSSSMYWTNVNFYGGYMLMSNCNLEYCRHCQNPDLLYKNSSSPPATQYTGTGYGLTDQLPNELLYDSNCKNIEKYALAHFSLETSAGQLNFTSVTFSEFRVRTSSVINVYLGSLNLTNVNFTNMEPGATGISADSNAIMSVAGIITATVPPSQLLTNQEMYCSWQNQPPSNPSMYYPCPTITWTGGIVTGLNRDYNYPASSTYDSYWRGVIAAYMVNTLTITGVSFQYNFANIADTSSQSSTTGSPLALINVAYPGSVSITNCVFDHNMADGGMIYIYVNRLYLNIYNAVNVLLTGLTFKNSFASNTATAINLSGTDNVNVQISNCTFQYGHGINAGPAVSLASASLSLQDYSGYSSPELYYNSLQNASYAINPISTVLSNLTFQNNYAGGMNLNAAGISISKLASVNMTNCTFSACGPHGEASTNTYSMWDYLVTNGLMMLGALPKNEANKQKNAGVVAIASSGSVVVSGCTFTSNSGNTAAAFAATTYIALTISGSTFASNTVITNRGTAMEVLMCPVIVGAYISITGCTFTSNAGANTPSQVSGVISNPQNSNCPNVQGLVSAADIMRVHVSSSVFTSNDGGLSLQAAELVITSTSFSSSSSQQNSAVQFANAANTFASVSANLLSITLCTFAGNSNTKGKGADISIADNNSQTQLTMSISSSTFRGSTAFGAASIFMSGNVAFGATTESAGYIKNCQFSGTVSTSGNGAILTAFTGIMIIASCTFSNLQAGGGYTYFLYASQQPNANRADSSKSVTYLLLNATTVTSGSKGSYGIYLIQALAEVRTNLCTFSSLVGGAVFNSQGYYVDTGSIFTGVTGSDHYFYIASLYGKGWFTNTIFNSGYASGNGGAVSLSDIGATAHFTSVTFENNQAVGKGGAIFISTDAYASITNCTFISNTASSGSAVYILTSIDTESYIISSSFKANSGVGVIYMLEGKLKLESCTFDSNTGTTPGLYLLLSTLTIKSSNFMNHSCNQGCFLYVIASSNVMDTGSSFYNSQSTKQGSVLFCQSSKITFTGSSISKTNPTTAGALHVLNQSYLTLSGVTLTKCYTTYGASGDASVIHLEQSYLSVSQTSIMNFNNMAIYAANMQQVSIDGLTVMYGNSSSSSGGALSCNSCPSFSISNSMFASISTTMGGCIYVVGDLLTHSITNSHFQDCNATMGGAIYASNQGFLITNTTFTSNNALSSGSSNSYAYGQGGALYFVCTDNLLCNSTVTNSTFSNNTAYSNGGAISWQNFEPNFINNTYSGNKARYGNDIASFAIKVAALTTHASSRLLEAISGVASGQVRGSPTLYMALYDKYGQIVSTDNSSSATLQSSDNQTSLSGTWSVTAVNGTFVFDSYGIAATPGSNTSISVSSNGIDTSKVSSASSSITIAVSLRNCTLGEIYTSSKACLVCGSNTYSLTLNASYCTPCPTSAMCLSGAEIYPVAGYWRSNNATDTFFACPRSASCLGNDNYSSQVGVCATGYTGNLCNVCASDYSRTSTDTCTICPDVSTNALRIFGIAFGVIVLIVFLVKSTMSSALRPSELTSVYLRILMNYLQLVMLTSTFNLNWPSLVSSLLSTQQSAGTATSQVFSFDCYMTSISSVNVLFQKLVMFFMMPGFIVLVSLVVWVMIAVKSGNYEVLKNQMVSTIIILLFLAHPNIVQTMFDMLSCTTIDPGQQWLVLDPSIKCWEGDHLFYILAIALPGVVLWCLGIPTAALFLIIGNRRNLLNIGVKAKYGFLYNGYKTERYYWEFIIIYRKIIIIFISVFVATISVDVQALSVMLVIIIAFYLQDKYNPYAAEELNDLEKLSIITSGITIYSGLYFLTNSLGNTAGIVFFFVIVLSNVFFLTYWVFGINRAYLEKIAKKKPRLMARLCRCIPSVLRVANLEIQQMDLQNFDVADSSYNRRYKLHEKRVIPTPRSGMSIIETAWEDAESNQEEDEEHWAESQHQLYLHIMRNVTFI